MNNLVKSVKSLKVYEWLMVVVMVVIAARAMVLAFIDPASSSNPPWLTVVNFVSAICGIFCVFLCAKACVSNFVFAIVNTVVYAIFLWYHRIFGTFWLETLFYFPMNIVSWIAWARRRDDVQPELTKSRKMTPWNWVMAICLLVLITLITHRGLVAANGSVPWLDAMTVAIGIVATILEMKRYREQYILWNITNVIALILYTVHFDPVYLTKKSIYMVMSLIGLYNWYKLNKNRNAENV